MTTLQQGAYRVAFRSLGISLTLCAAALLGACSGGSSSNNNAPQEVVSPPPTPPTPPTTLTLDGTAAIGAPIVGGTVSARCADGSGFTQAIVTSADGSWSGTIGSAALPCALQVSGGAPPVTLHSYANSAGTINITPLTDLTLALATSQSPQDWFNNFDGSSVDIDTASNTLLDTLATKGFIIPATGNPFTTSFTTDGSGWDGLLDDVARSIAADPSLADHAALVDLVKAGNLASLPAAPEPEKFSISGTISGASANVIWYTLVGGSVVMDGSDSNGAATFSPAEGITKGSAWTVAVNTPPAGQTCQLQNNSGILANNVTNVEITCSDIVINPDTYSISGSISGASGPVQWQTRKDGGVHHSGTHNNGSVTFTLAGGMAAGSAWGVQVLTPPAGQTCAVSNGGGTLSADIGNVLISCKDKTIVPSEALYDFSALNLKPVVPANLTPIAPSVTPIDPSLDIAALYASLGERELARIFAPAPVNLDTEFDTYNTEYTIYQRDQNSNWARHLSVNPGADNALNTADDIIVAYTVFPDGELGIQYSFTNPGPDATWFTTDDVPGIHHSGKVVYFPQGTVLEYEDASEGVILILPFLDTGADGKLFTADDVVNFSVGYQIAILDGEGNRGQIVTYDGTGSDGLWFTADDRVKSYLIATSALSGRQVISVTYNGAGADSRWFSADDVVTQHTQSQLDSEYIIRYTATYNARGGDNTWFTADDTVLAWTYYGYDEEGNPVLVANHTNKGSDGIWFTADDTATGVVGLKDANGYPIAGATITGSGAMGPDGIWLSGDETLFGYAYTRYDENGNQILNAQMQSKGDDGKWFTADDLPTATYNYWEREFDAQGRILQQVYYDPALAPASQAFSVEQVSQYTVYKADFSTSVTVYRDSSGSTFGADGLPFSADDFIPWPYTVVTATGYEQFNQPGPDGTWFTGDDVKSGYVVSQHDGNRKTLEQHFDTSDKVISYSEVTDQTANSYRTNMYHVDSTGTAELTGYNMVEEGSHGFPRWTTWYSVAGEITNVDYTEYDSNGNITRQSSSYAPGNDGIWATADDFRYYSLQHFNSNNELIAHSSEYPGPDGLWGTADDYAYFGPIVQLDYDINALAGNAGYLAPRCDDLISVASGAINVVVRDQNGKPLAGAVAQLNSHGATSTSDADGRLSFTGLSGTQDLHLFKDGYGWESFYCVAPGAEVTVQARLTSLSELAHDSKVNFRVNPGSERFTLRLLDEQGNPVAVRAHSTSTGGESGQTYGALHFALPVGTEVSGELWAFQVDAFGRLFSAQSLGNRTYTTIASNLFSDYQEIDVAFEPSSPVPVASRGSVVSPGNRHSTPTVSLGGIYELPFLYESSLSGTFATTPDTGDVMLPQLAQPTGIRASSENWQAWYPGDYPMLGEVVFNATLVTGFQYEALIPTQDATGEQPVIHWSPVRQVKDESFATVSTLELRNASSGLGYQSHWTIHVPAGSNSVQLPTLPAGISDPLLPKSQYRMVMRTRALPELDYHTVIGTEDLHNLNPAYTTELLTTGSDFGEGGILRR